MYICSARQPVLYLRKMLHSLQKKKKKKNPTSYKYFFIVEFIASLKMWRKKKLIFLASFMLLPLVTYRRCSVIHFNSTSNWLHLAAFFVQGENQEGGIMKPVHKACFWKPTFDLLGASPSVPLLLHSVSSGFARHSLQTMPSLWPTSAAHPHV